MEEEDNAVLTCLSLFRKLLGDHPFLKEFVLTLSNIFPLHVTNHPGFTEIGTSEIVH